MQAYCASDIFGSQKPAADKNTNKNHNTTKDTKELTTCKDLD